MLNDATSEISDISLIQNKDFIIIFFCGGFPIRMQNMSFVEDDPMNIPTKFGFN
jgi:hypothetical protein